jgi:hypothetical protein
MQNTTACIAIALTVLVFFAACDKPAPTEESTAGSPDVQTRIEIQSSTPAAERLTSFIDAVRTGERATIESLIRDGMAGFLQEIPMDDHVAELMGYHPGFSQITFHHLTQNEPHAATGLFHNTQSDRWVEIGVAVEDTPPHRIYQIELQPAQAPN